MIIVATCVLASCSAWQRATRAEQRIAIPSPYSSNIEERERAIVYAAIAPTNLFGLASVLVLGNIQQQGLAKTRREIEYNEQDGTLRAVIEADTASWFGETLNSIADAVTTVGNWISQAASGAAGTFRAANQTPTTTTTHE